MSNRTTVIAACAVVLSIAGCAGKTRAAQPNTPLPEVPATTSSSAPPLEPDALTPTGTSLAFGEAARVMYETKPEGKDKTKIAVTPASVKHAPISDFQDVNLKADELTKEYFYVTMSFTNLGPLPMDPVVAMSYIGARDTAGKEMNRLHFMIGSFAPCHQEYPGNLAVGATHTACAVYVAREGQDAGEVVSAATRARTTRSRPKLLGRPGNGVAVGRANRGSTATQMWLCRGRSVRRHVVGRVFGLDLGVVVEPVEPADGQRPLSLPCAGPEVRLVA